MIAAMRPDIDNVDEYVRNTTARAFSGAAWLQGCGLCVEGGGLFVGGMRVGAAWGRMSSAAQGSSVSWRRLFLR